MKASSSTAVRALVALLLLPLLLTQCSTRKAEDGFAILLAQSKGRALENYSAYVVIKSVDGRELGEGEGRRGIKLTPGSHRVLVSARRDVGANTGGWILGIPGALIGAALDSSHSQLFQESLTFTAESGKRYIAKLRDDGRRYSFWIANERTRMTVSTPAGSSR